MCIQTDRLVLRPWKERDFSSFRKLNADSRVMEFYPSTLTQEESDQKAKKIQANIEKNGWGFWAVSELGKDNFMGFIGLNEVTFSAPFTPAIEVGWRLHFAYWGKGYATEGAKACLDYGFNTLKLDEIIAFTTAENTRSRRIMEKIGMRHHPQDDFDHPKLSIRQVLYRSKREIQS